MTQTLAKAQRNQSVECARLLAAVLVVFIHCPFPGLFGEYIACLGRYAVPMFFAISGFYSFGISAKKIRSRMMGVLRLYLLSALLYLLWNIFVTEYRGGSTIAYLRSAVPEVDEVARFLFLSVAPYVGHLWYLLAMVGCYLGLWVYVRFYEPETVNYRPLYLLGAFLLADHITTAALLAEIPVENPFYWCRSGLLFGLPMFALGVFLGEHWERLIEKFSLTTRKLLILLAVCAALSLIQWRGGVDSGCMEFGTMLGTVILLLFLLKHPVVTRPEGVIGKGIARFGKVSMWVYIMHLMVIYGYELFLQPVMEARAGEGEPWLRPWVVLGITLLISIVFERLAAAAKRKKTIQ